MTSETFNTGDILRRVIADGRLSPEAFESITGIPRDALTPFLAVTPTGTPGMATPPAILTSDQTLRLSSLVAQLTAGFEIDDDERVRGILETLTVQFRLTSDNISHLTQIHAADIELFIADPATVSPEVRYRLAVRASYLLNAIGNASPKYVTQ
ncbi:hypothetical protein B7R21_16610 [Subtercola boreus]|uniref:Uncharacterized protein n=2 Tax=Subtercola boreus TaxID=120213 RepID=A0A3E0VBL1_9MICO|nr:hypothetical protein B7R21_16610 [Subtercola boreus]